MNVVIAALSAPSQLNGVSRYGANLVRALLSTDKVREIHFICGGWQKEMFRSVLPEGDSRLHVHSILLRDANFCRLIWYFRELPSIAEQLEAEIVHFTYAVPIAKGAFSIPTVLTLHDLYPFDVPENFGTVRSALARRTVSACVETVDAVSCVSETTRKQFARWFGREAGKATVIPNVVELLPPSLADSGIKALNGRSFVLLIAQHRANKNVLLAVRIFQRAIERRVLHPDTRLVIVGIRGPETGRLKNLILESRLSNRVLLLSGLPEDRLRWCYDNCALLLAPSSIEGFGLPVAEGILAGCRIVSSDIPAFRELPAYTCRFVPWGGEILDSYARAIRDVLGRAKPPARSLPLNTPESAGRQYLALYESLICSRVPDFDMLRQPEAVPKAFNS